MKLCAKCGQTKPLDCFSKNAAARDGLNRKCKACDSAYQAERYLKAGEQIRANAKRWAAENAERRQATNAAWREQNAAHRAAYMRDWYAANRADQQSKQAEWRAANREYIAERNAAWRRANPGLELALSRAKKAAKKKRMPKWADLEAIKAIYDKAAALRAQGLDVHVDHYYPLQGETVSGLHVPQNLRIIPAAVNLRKRNRHPEV